MKWILVCPVFLLYFNSSFSWDFLDPVTKYSWWETCSSGWIVGNVKGLENNFSSSVYGQPFLGELVPLLKRHFSFPEKSKKALVLSFHGSVGIGKNYVLEFIARNLFKKGTDSKFYKFITKSDSIHKSKESIKDLVIKTVRECGRSMFVFDDVETMEAGIFENLKPFLDYHAKVEDVDYRKSIFIFLSNIGMERINKMSFSLWKQGIHRNDFNLPDFETALFEHSYNDEGGLKKTSLVKNYLVDLYVPFLPLEKKHVKNCILAEAKNLDYTVDRNAIEKILKSMTFLPEEIGLYSASGCKAITSLIFRYGQPNDEL